MSNAKQQLENAFKAALSQYADTMGENFPQRPKLDVISDAEFWAMAVVEGDESYIRVATGTVDNITTLWTTSFADEGIFEGFGKATKTSAATMVEISLVWLMLHELHHFQMGHFGSGNPTTVSMYGEFEEFMLVTRTTNCSTNAPFESGKQSQILALEMEADHDATEMLLDAYSAEQWPSLRARIAAISAIMMLIERLDASNQMHSATHPEAATRIFQLLGHVTEMPFEAHRSSAFGMKEELKRFVAHVAVPAYFDAISLSKFASAKSIGRDLSTATDFFRDIQTAKLKSNPKPSDFITSGAKQWSELSALRNKVVDLGE